MRMGRQNPRSFLILAYSAGSIAPLSSTPASRRAGSLGSQRTSAKTPRLTRSRVGIMFSSRRTKYFRMLFFPHSRLALAPEIPHPDEAIAAHRVGLTAASRRDMAADVVHAQRHWHVLPQVLQGQTLHLFVDLDGLREF